MEAKQSTFANTCYKSTKKQRFDKHLITKFPLIKSDEKMKSIICSLNVNYYFNQILLEPIKHLLETSKKIKSSICKKL